MAVFVLRTVISAAGSSATKAGVGLTKAVLSRHEKTRTPR